MLTQKPEQNVLFCLSLNANTQSSLQHVKVSDKYWKNLVGGVKVSDNRNLFGFSDIKIRHVNIIETIFNYCNRDGQSLRPYM